MSGQGIACCPTVARPGLWQVHVWSQEAGKRSDRAAEVTWRANTGLRGRGKGERPALPGEGRGRLGVDRSAIAGG